MASATPFKIAFTCVAGSWLLSCSSKPERRYAVSDITRLPCGCQFWTEMIDGEGAFVFEPCSETCEVYLYAKAEAARQGKPTTVIDMR